jgi:hypothetical protein
MDTDKNFINDNILNKNIKHLNKLEFELIKMISDTNNNELMDKFLDWQNQKIKCNQELIKEYKFNKKDMLFIAEFCMQKLLSTKREKSEFSEITSYDVYRIKMVLNEVFNGE